MTALQETIPGTEAAPGPLSFPVFRALMVGPPRVGDATADLFGGFINGDRMAGRQCPKQRYGGGGPGKASA